MANVDGWYLKQDGTYADPANCDRGKDGILREKDSGLLIATTVGGEPITVASGAAMNKNVDAANAGKAPSAPDVNQAPAPGPAPAPAPAQQPAEPLGPMEPSPAQKAEPKK
jgi:hypothetical protein